MKALSLAVVSMFIVISIQSPAVLGDEPATKQTIPATAKALGNERFDRLGDALPAGATLRIGTTRLRNGQGVEGVAFSPDGKWLASCGWDDSIRFWDVATSRPSGRLVTDEGDGTFAVAFSADSAKLASVSERGFVRLWDVATGRQLWKVLGHLEEAAGPRQFGTRVYGVAFSPDGGTLATGGSDRTVNLWDAATGKKLREFDTHSEGGDARPVAFSLDGKLFASACPNGQIFVWNPATGDVVCQVEKAHERDVASLVFTRDGQELISAGIHFERTEKRSATAVVEIRTWDAFTGEERPAFGTPNDLTGETTLALSPDGKKLYSAHFDRIIVWDVATRSPTRYIRVDGAQLGGRTHGLAVSPDGNLLASKAHWNRRNKVWLWDLEKRNEMFGQDDAHGSSVLAVRYSPDGSQIVTGSADNTVRLWDATTGKQVRLVDRGTGWVRYVDFSPDGKRLLLGRETHEPKQSGFKGEIKVYNVADGSLITEMAAPDRVMCGALSADAKVVAAALGLGGPAGPAGDPFGGDQGGAAKVVVWDATTGQQLAAFDRGQGAASSLAFSPDGDELTLVSQDKSVQRWTWRKAKEIPLPNAPPKASRGGHYTAACSPRGSTCVFGGMARGGNKTTGELSTVELQNGTTLWEKQFDDVRPRELAISPDGTLLATYLKELSSAKSVSRLAIWSVHDGKELLSFDLADDAVRSLAFSLDGSRLVSGMELGDALVWNIAPAREKLK